MHELTYRVLHANESSRVREIDRAEVIDRVYRVRAGTLVLENEHHAVEGWAPGSIARNEAQIHECLERGGRAWGALHNDQFVGIAVLDGRWISSADDTLNLYFLHVSNGFRDRGIGRELLDLAKARAIDMGARRLYVSATPSDHTVHFYLGVGFMLTSRPDRELLDREPDDIHMDMKLVPTP